MGYKIKPLSLFSAILMVFLQLFIQSKAQHKDTLSNNAIIRLYKGGIGKEILKSKIQNSPAKFDVSVDAILELKKVGIPEEVINLMITNSNGTHSPELLQSNSFSTRENGAEGGINLSSGIYYMSPEREYLEVEPSVLTSTKTNNAAQVLFSGFINSKIKSTLSDKESSFKILESGPKFIFVFDTLNNTNLNNEGNAWFSGTRSPKEFLLVKLTVSKNSREITTGKANVVSSNMGIDDKFVIRFSSKKISRGVYEVTCENKLEKGEYCFMFAQGLKQGQSSKVFDFSIK